MVIPSGALSVDIAGIQVEGVVEPVQVGGGGRHADRLSGQLIDGGQRGIGGYANHRGRGIVRSAEMER